MIADTFGWFGFLMLIFLSVEDFKTGDVDTRLNFFMKGLLVGCVLWAGMSLINLLLLILLTVILNTVLFKTQLGNGDKSTLQWAAPGFMLASGTMPFWYYSLSFFGIFFCVLIGIALFKKFTKREGSSAGMPLILMAYLINIMLIIMG